MSQFGYIDIENDELQKYFDEVKKKVGICEILPRGRFSLRTNGVPVFNGLVCSEKMGGRQTGVSASCCENCLKETTTYIASGLSILKHITNIMIEEVEDCKE